MCLRNGGRTEEDKLVCAWNPNRMAPSKGWNRDGVWLIHPRSEGSLRGDLMSIKRGTGMSTDDSKQIVENNLEKRTLEAINTVFRERIHCATLEDLCKRSLSVAEELTGSKFGWIGELNPLGKLDTIAISNPGWDACRMPTSNATLLIRDMALRGVWSRVVLDGKGFFTNDPMNHPDSVGVPDDHPPLTAFLGAPLRRGEQVIGMVSVANKEGGYQEQDSLALESLSVAINEAIHSKRVEERISKQTQELLEISTPILQVWEGIVIAPLIGTLDSQRTQHFMERLLQAIVDNNSPLALVDITGVPTVDTQTAQHLIESISAAKLLGAKVILTGIRPNIAQTLVHLGVDLADIETCSSLSTGLRMALGEMGLGIVKQG